MGIKGIKKLINKHAPGSIVPFSVESLKGRKIAIDSSILLYKFRYLNESDNFHIIGFQKVLNDLESWKCDGTFVFDGTPPQAKQKVLSDRSELRKKQKERLSEISKELEKYDVQRVCEFIDSDDESQEESQENTRIKKLLSEEKKIKKNLLIVTKQHSLEVMEFLKGKEIKFIHAEGEAEKECSRLQKTGEVDYILTEDTDSLAFGGSNVIFTVKKDYFLCDLNLVLQGLEINYDSFVDLCILCGCDYTGTIPKIGPVTALKLIKKHLLIENMPINIPSSFEYELSRKLFKFN
jgi:flap endonuclease-1